MADRNQNYDSGLRQDHEQPAVIRQGWRYHHIGIPTETQGEGEQYLEEYKMYVALKRVHMELSGCVLKRGVRLVSLSGLCPMLLLKLMILIKKYEGKNFWVKFVDPLKV